VQARDFLKAGVNDKMHLLLTATYGRVSGIVPDVPEVIAEKDDWRSEFAADTSSIYRQTVQKWLGAGQNRELPLSARYIAGGMIGLFLVLSGLNLLLRHQVARQTQSLTETNRHLREEVSKRQKTMQELKKYARVVEASNDAIALFDRDNNHLLVNNAYLETLRYARNALQMTTLPEVVGQEFFQAYLELPIARCLKGEQVDITAVFTPPGSSPRHWHIHLGPYLVSENFILGYALDIRDITQQVELENQLKHAQKMEAIGMLAGGVAHDLNNILSGLVSYPDMLLVNRAQNDPMYRPLQIIKSSGERAAAIVSDLLTLARRGVENIQPTNFNTIISEFSHSLDYDLLLRAAPGVEVRLSLDDELLNIMGSRVHLAKCLTNLFTNGLEAMPGGGILTISTGNRYLEQHEVPDPRMSGGDYVVLTVADTGMGMSQEKVTRIFEPFYTSKIMGRSGTGLGMTLVWGAVKDHGGHITVDSTPGAGTSFTLLFPATRKTGIACVRQELDDYRGTGESILVIDDVEQQRLFASEMLVMLGYAVETADSGETAIAKIREKDYDILILDMIMPGGMDGLTTYQKALAIKPGQKAIIASGFSDTSKVAAAQALGAGSYVCKPYTVVSLAKALQKELHPDGPYRN
jgi:PAS domain S-box-containing protein